MTHALEPPRPAAVLVAIQLPSVSDEDFQASIAELGRLVDTLGFDVVGSLRQKRASYATSVGIGGGKLRELARMTGGTGIVPSGAQPKKQKKDLHKVDLDDDDDQDDGDDENTAVAEGLVTRAATVVVVDNELTPSQIRNLEKATGVEVLDRSGVIIEIFHRHAHTREAKLQVEIARLTYEAPRMREKESNGDRQRGGGVGGKGDNDLELDKRRMRDRIAELRHELELIHQSQDTRRKRRRDQMKVALVGYTNAGKSSLMRALTGSDVLVADKLFATLGTTVRALHPETNPRILISDTVGFIKNLPHGLVASFRSTLDEAHEASLLLFVVDSSDPAFRSQLEVTRTVLGEIGAADIPSRLVLNKTDRLDDDTRAALRTELPDAILTSAVDAGAVAALRLDIINEFEKSMCEQTLVIPYGSQGVLGEIRENARVLKEDYDEDGVHLQLRAAPETLARLATLITERGSS